MYTPFLTLLTTLAQVQVYCRHISAIQVYIYILLTCHIYIAVATRPQLNVLFCFRCCEDIHIARNCEIPINKAPVNQRY